jgi:cytochrome c biogenesis protein CcdA
MYCPNCGKADQTPETYCRQCGLFLSDFSTRSKQEASPEENLKVNLVLSLLTIIASFTLAILLYAILGFRENTHWLIYATAGLLIAIGSWHIQTFIRTRQLRRQWQRRTKDQETKDAASLQRPTTSKLLSTPAQDAAIPPTVTEDTTRDLADTKIRSS